MPGIVFFGTESHDEVVDFYVDTIGATVWLEQPDCTILQYDNQLLGFCERETADTEGTITFVVDTKEAVDTLYRRLTHVADGEPTENERYRIYQCFGTDPEGRTIEIQTFLHETEPV
ncbi:VOC family protein [Natranaeroarchaeum sulfidigenes]|uniref:Glyoxalase n=1 Tax=Natranaeroarchaeum sulfidigenes TaxID=2784880 RepID=A0A897MTT6_9EURY|nr:VOC family protein [Natranaeroarchaeum sulfidigenes]QSG03887.1 Uncharacterized protein AArcS_2691 [Natranaeroarchaeum sulfidigenes]